MGYKVKRIMVGDKQVRPSGFELKSNLVNSSLAQLQSEGWTDIVGSPSYSIGSDGLKIGGTSTFNNAWFALYKYFPDLSSDDIIEVNYKGSGTRSYSGHNWQYNCFISCGIYNVVAALDNNCFQGGYNTGTNDHGCIGINKGWTGLGTLGTTFLGGDVNITFKINLKTGECNYTCTSPISFSSSYTLSSSDLATARTNKYIYFGGNIFEGNNNYVTLKEASIKISKA